MATRRAEVAERIARADPAGLLYGAIVTAAVLATVSAHAGEKQHVAVATFVVLVVYWLAHVYVATQAMQYHGDRRPVHQRLASAAVHETSVLKGGVPALAVYLAAGLLLGLEPGDAAIVALYFSMGFLMLAGYLGAHRAGMRTQQSLLEGAVAGLLGVVAILAKLVLH
jgi:hypothetical protein